MYDMHYDLLTILYFNYKKGNPLANPLKMIENLTKIYKNNIKGGIINLYFESIQEMKDEVGIDKSELLDVITMLKTSINHLNRLKEEKIIPKDIDYIYSIEGCDYIKDENELDDLYKLGVRSILPVWNNKNKFGSGNRSNFGLTDLGIKLINKATNLNMIVDVSHANIRTFYDILDNINDNTNLIASHSNVRTLCDRERNLNDDQLLKLKNKKGYIGLFVNGNFLSMDNLTLNQEQRIQSYLKHLDYVIKKIGFSEDKILLSTDNMDFMKESKYHNLSVCPYENTYELIHDAISKKYNNEIADMIIEENAKKLIKKVNLTY